MKLSILAFAAHPDDVELSCSGTLAKHISIGEKVGIIDLTKGELGTRGSAELRAIEAEKASNVLGLHCRENLGMPDGFFQNTPENQLAIIQRIRFYRPDYILCNAIRDRHPDHGKASQLVSDACFYSGLSKIESVWKGEKQTAWRPKAVYHYIQDRYITPDFIVDISAFIDKKMDSILAYSSQFYDPNSAEPKTPISSLQFIEGIKNRAMECGRIIGVEYGEAFTCERIAGVDNLHSLR